MMAGGIGFLHANHGAGGPGMLKSIRIFAPVLVGVLIGSLAAQAQGFPPPPGDQPKSQICVRRLYQPDVRSIASLNHFSIASRTACMLAPCVARVVRNTESNVSFR